MLPADIVCAWLVLAHASYQAGVLASGFRQQNAGESHQQDGKSIVFVGIPVLREGNSRISGDGRSFQQTGQQIGQQIGQQTGQQTANNLACKLACKLATGNRWRSYTRL